MDMLAHPAGGWLAIGILLVIVEMLTGTFFFLFLGIGALLVSSLVWTLGIGGLAQGVVFGMSAIVAVGAWWKLRPNPDDRIEQLSGAAGLNNPNARFVGREADLAEAIHGGEGRIRLDDSLWFVTGPDLPAGSRVRVVGVSGAKLRVEPVTGITL
jgi:membrane protein implicated in regulation of membrane protease activity